MQRVNRHEHHSAGKRDDVAPDPFIRTGPGGNHGAVCFFISHPFPISEEQPVFDHVKQAGLFTLFLHPLKGCE
jgi:hypothetical protein